MRNADCYEMDQPLSFVHEVPAGFWHSLFRAPAKLIDAILIWQERVDQRSQLASLGDHELRDIGLSRADVEHETSLPFWRGC